MIRVVIADDHPHVRLAVRSYLELEDDFEVIGEAETGEQAVDVVRRERPDLVLLDYQMPVLDGLGAARAIGEAFPEVAIVMLSAMDEGRVMTEAAGAGVGGFVHKGDPPNVLASTLRRVAGEGEGHEGEARHPEELSITIEPEALNERTDR